MKYPVFFIGLLLFFLAGRTQPRQPLSRLPTVVIHLEKPAIADSTGTGLFRHFEIIDDRADTARIGIHTLIRLIGGAHNRQLVLRQPAAREIAGWLNENYARPEGRYSALIVLRNLWLSDANYVHEDKVKNPDVLDDRTHIRLKMEVYAVADSQYIPLLRFDTLQTYKRNNTYNNLSSYYSIWARDLAGMLKDMADSLSGLVAGKVAHGRRIRFDDILRFNHARFDAAIVKADALMAGVYANFDEFRNNAPSIQHFEIREDNGDQLLYIKDAAGASYFSHDAWGYCDGKKLYIMRDGILFPLWKEGNGYYFLSTTYKETTQDIEYFDPGTSDIHSPGGAVVPGKPGGWYPAGTRKVSSTVQRIFTVDMDSGKSY